MHIPLKAVLSATVGAGLLAAGPAAAAGEQAGGDSRQQAKQQQGWVSFTGTVEKVGDEEFLLSHGGETITVDMDDFDRYSENLVVKGDQVTASGIVDEDLVEGRELEASSVFFDSINEYVYASPADEEIGYYAYLVNDAAKQRRSGELAVLTGTVSDLGKSAFTLDTGLKKAKIDTSEINGDVLRKQGRRGLDPGDRVSVVGEAGDASLLQDWRLTADSVTVISDAS